MFELCVVNPDKGALSHSTLLEREAAFAARGAPLTLTAAKLFVDKARLFASSVFVLGEDTARRIVMPKYYESETSMALEFERLRAANCRFAVAGRLDQGDGEFKTLEDVDVPRVLRDMDLFVAIPESAFRADISSSELRERARAEQ
jgi:hypothetical protein